MKFGETVTSIPVLKAVICGCITIQSVYDFGQRSGSEMSTNLIFPWSVLAAINFVGWQLEMKGLESEPDVSWGFSMVRGQHSPTRDMDCLLVLKEHH